MDEFNLDDSPKDLGKHRTLALENGNKVHFKCHDPYGFWTINLDKGQLPDTLTGHYTTYDYAEKAFRNYLLQKDETIVTPEPKLETLFVEPKEPQSPPKKVKKAA